LYNFEDTVELVYRLIRYFFVGPGRIPIFCVNFCSSYSGVSNPRGVFCGPPRFLEIFK